LNNCHLIFFCLLAQVQLRLLIRLVGTSLANIINNIVEAHESVVECVKASELPAYSFLCAFGSLGV